MVTLLVGLLAISGVNASDISNETAVSTENSDVSINEVNTEQTLEIASVNQIEYNENSQVIKSSDSVKTFDDLRNEINKLPDNGKLDLYSDYKYNGTGDFSGIPITKNNVTIDGNGHTIDANAKGIIFLINGNNVTLKNLIFTNSNIAISNYGGGLSVVGSSFINNTKSAIDNGGNMSVVGSSFINNSANYGGAIDNWGNVDVVGSSFINNSAEYGGAIGNWENMSVVGSEFINNRAKNGGAIINIGDFWGIQPTNNFTIRNSVFVNNTAKKGGAISSYGPFFINENNTFKGNNATDGNDVYSDVDNQGYKVAFFNSTSVIDLTPKEIQWNVKNLTETEDYYGETLEYNVYLSTFKINNVEYVMERYDPTLGQYGYYVYLKFNPGEYNVYDSILYKIDNNNIVDVIPPREYHVFDGEYYRVVGIMGNYEKYLDEDFISYSIIDNECYKFNGTIEPFVVGVFTKAIQGIDYKIIDGKYYTLNGELIESFFKVYLGDDEDENSSAIINGFYYFATENGIYYYSNDGLMKYIIAPYNYVKLNDTIYRLCLGEGTYNTTSDDGEAYTNYNEYVLIDNQLYNIKNGNAVNLVIF